MKYCCLKLNTKHVVIAVEIYEVLLFILIKFNHAKLIIPIEYNNIR